MWTAAWLFVKGVAGKIPAGVWKALGAVAVALAFLWVAYSAGADDAREKMAKEQADTAARAVKVTQRAQVNLDGETRRIGEDVARAEARTVTIVERTKTEVRYEMAKEADPLERLRIWRDRARELRDTLDVDGEPGADGASPSGSAEALRGTLAP